MSPPAGGDDSKASPRPPRSPSSDAPDVADAVSTAWAEERHLTVADLGPLIEDQWGDTPLPADKQHLKDHFRRCQLCSDAFARIISSARYTI